MGQTQLGVWLSTRHSAPDPHRPGQGSLQRWLMQAWLVGHSELVRHSGLQLGGLPVYSGRQVHEGLSPTTRHSEYGPQGDGEHGATLTTSRLGSTMRWQLTNGLPEKRSGQRQKGLWLTTWHLAFEPHVPGQGSVQRWLRQAWLRGHSELVVHSGRQKGGLPENCSRQEQTACWLTCWHRLLGPHGDG